MRRLLLAIALALATSTAIAAAPTSEQLVRARGFFAMDLAIDIAIDQGFREHAGADWNDTQRRCVAGQVRPFFAKSVDDSFRELFGTGENIDAWIAFGETPGGRKMLDFVRNGVETVVKGGGQPDPMLMLGQMTQDELRAVAEFMSTPAGQILQKPFPQVRMPEAELKALQPVVERTCDVHFD